MHDRFRTDKLRSFKGATDKAGGGGGKGRDGDLDSSSDSLHKIETSNVDMGVDDREMKFDGESKNSFMERGREGEERVNGRIERDGDTGLERIKKGEKVSHRRRDSAEKEEVVERNRGRESDIDRDSIPPSSSPSQPFSTSTSTSPFQSYSSPRHQSPPSFSTSCQNSSPQTAHSQSIVRSATLASSTSSEECSSFPYWSNQQLAEPTKAAATFGLRSSIFSKEQIVPTCRKASGTIPRHATE